MRRLFLLVFAARDGRRLVGENISRPFLGYSPNGLYTVFMPEGRIDVAEMGFAADMLLVMVEVG